MADGLLLLLVKNMENGKNYLKKWIEKDSKLMTKNMTLNKN